MKKVNLELSADQYKELLKLVYVGDWVIDEPENMVLNDLVQTIFSKADEAGMKKLVEMDDDLGLFLPSQELDEEVITIINDYEDECFWDTLIFGLSERDAEKKLGKELEKMSMDEKLEILEPYSKKYIDEFEKNGLDNVKVK
ncbi:MAG TPA: hypothetical protein PKN48_08475 [Bacteroidales bacterium]|nr:hypothetical protein [Bacteroidales bacterium]